MRLVDDYVNNQSFCCNGGDFQLAESLGAQSATDTAPALYFYHPDHLGSTAMVTNLDGHITQNVVYIPFGEVFVEERNGSWASPYLFNAKELDEETGLYYYGARYLDPTGAMWLSVDPKWEDYSFMTPYNYCAGNPVKLVDPDGREASLEGITNDEGVNNRLVLASLRQINAQTNGIIVRRDKNTKNLSYIYKEGKKLTEIDKRIIEIIDSKDRFVHLEAIPGFYCENQLVVGGGYWSTFVNDEGKAHSVQIINPVVLAAIDGSKGGVDDVYPLGTAILHEIDENFIASGIYIRNYEKFKKELEGIDPKSEEYKTISKRQKDEVYKEAHLKALSQPYFKEKIDNINGQIEIESFRKDHDSFNSKTKTFKLW